MRDHTTYFAVTLIWMMLKHICWSDVINEEHPDAALDEFVKLLLPVIDKHAPVKKMTVRTVKAPYIDEELNNCMVKRDGAKRSLAVHLTGLLTAN
jgi:hypothetical protein